MSRMIAEKMFPDVMLPNKNQDDAGYDVRSYMDCSIESGESLLISTGLKIQLPKNTDGRIASRSGLAVKGIEVGAGVVDCNYRGEVKVLLRNFGKNTFNISKNDRIAQLIVSPYLSPEIVEGELETSDRNEKGFGSSGVN